MRTSTRLISVLLISLLLLLPSSQAALSPTSIVVPNTDIVDDSETYKDNVAGGYLFQFSNPPFTFADPSGNISAFVVEGKQDWGSIPRTDPVRRTVWNYTISNATSTHYIQFENAITESISIWFTSILVTIDGVPTYQLSEHYSTFHPFSFDYRTSFTIGMAKNATMRAWNPGNSGQIGTGNTLCSVITIGGGCGPRVDLTTLRASNLFNYTTGAVFITNPGAGQGSFNIVKKGYSGDSDTDWYFAFNLTNPTSVTTTISYDGPQGASAGFVYDFVLGADSVAQANAEGTACNGLFSGLVYSFFGFCPNVLGVAEYVGGFVGGLITFPLKLLGGSDASAAGSIAEGVSSLVQSLVSFYTLGLVIIIQDPVRLSAVSIGLISSYSALIGGLMGDPRIAFRGTFLGIKWYAIVVVGYFVVLFYVVKGLVWLIVQIVQGIIAAVSAARSFFKLV